MKHKKVPNLAGIHEFGAAAYVKDLKAGKLDARAKVGRFVGYDSESKGFRIYWPSKRSVSVERNVVFNEDDVLTEEDNVTIRGHSAKYTASDVNNMMIKCQIRRITDVRRT